MDLNQAACLTHQFVDCFDHVDGDADSPGLVGDRTGNCLANPPRRIGRKLESTPVIKLFDRPDEAYVAFLDEIEEL